MAELSLIQFQTTNFFALMMSHRPFTPITTNLMKIARSLIMSNDSIDKKYIEKIKWIELNTHEKLKLKLSAVELVVFKNLNQNLNREVEIGRKTYNLIDLYTYIDEVIRQLSDIVTEIVKDYSVDIPLGALNKSSGSLNVSA